MGNFNRDRGGRNSGRHNSSFNRGGDRRDSGFNRDRNARPMMHKAVCDACHQNCEVPFKPTGNKPIFCSECFSKQGGSNRRDDKGQKPRFEGGSNDNSKEILKGIKTLNYKLDELIKVLASETPTEKTEEIKVSSKKTSKKKVVKKTSKKKNTTSKKVVKRKTPKKKPVVKKPVKKKAKKK